MLTLTAKLSALVGRHPRAAAWLFGATLLVTALALRAPGMAKQIWNLDEASTFTMAEIVRDGGVLYRDAADNRTPLVPYLKAAIFTVVGDWNLTAVHWAVALMLGLTAVWLWRLARAAGDATTGRWGAVFFTLLSFTYLTVVDTMTAHTGWFLVFFSALGLWCVVLLLRGGTLLLGPLAGTLFGCAALAKQPGLLDFGVGVMLTALAAWHGSLSWSRALRIGGGLTAGFLAVLVLTWGYFAAHGAWDDFLRYAWNYNTKLYVPEVAPLDRLLGIRTPFQLAWRHTPFALLLGIVAAGWLLGVAFRGQGRRQTEFPLLPWLILGWTASGLASTVLSGRDFAHYSIQVLPGLSLACGWVWPRLWRARCSPLVRVTLRCMLLAVLIGLGFHAVKRSATFDTQESLSLDVTQVIRDHTRADERIFVWGYEPELYALSGRLPATRFIYAVFLTGMIPWTNIDPLRDTAYAIVPGSWDDFWADFRRSPPALIVDTRGNRGFGKYPMRQQTELWRVIQRDYVEVIDPRSAQYGYALYRRAVPLASSDTAAPAIAHDWSLQAPARVRPNETFKVFVSPPQGSTTVTLWLDGHAYRRATCPPERPGTFAFFIDAALLQGPTHTLRAVATGTVAQATPSQTITLAADAPPQRPVVGPPIQFGETAIAPYDIETGNDSAELSSSTNGHWRANAPTYLHYHRPPGLAVVAIHYRLLGASAPITAPDGIDLVVRFTGANHRVETLYRQHLDPVAPGAHAFATVRVAIPGVEPGTLSVCFSPGPMGDAAYDWVEISALQGELSPLSLNFDQHQIPPTSIEAAHGIDLVTYQNREVVFAHAPMDFTVPQVPGLAEISGEFGLLESAWTGEKKSAGAIFSIAQLRTDGAVLPLFEKRLDPARSPADRAIQHFQVTLPAAADAVLRYAIRPADPRDNGYNHTFWANLRGWKFRATIATPTGPLKSIAADAPNGLAEIGEVGMAVTFAHAPSQLEFALPAGLRRFTGDIGLIASAYTGNGTTQGARFIIEHLAPDGTRRTLLDRTLRPLTTPSDRGPQPFTVELGASSTGTLILRTAPAPGGRLDFTWCYWHDLKLNN